MESLRLDTDTEVWNIMDTDILNLFFINNIKYSCCYSLYHSFQNLYLCKKDEGR